MIVIINIMPHRGSRRKRPPRRLTNTFCLVQPVLATSQLFHSALFRSFSAVISVFKTDSFPTYSNL